MTISLDGNKLKRLALYALWIAVIVASAITAYRYLADKPPRYAIIKVGDLIKEEQTRLLTENFQLYKQTSDIEAAAQAYYERISAIANAVARQENLIIFDGAAILGLPPESAIDITPFIRRELANAPR
jgi:hypothetical protein